jgi:hypothetical protein
MKSLPVGIVIVVLSGTVGCRKASSPPPPPSVQAAPSVEAGTGVAEFPDYPGASRIAYSERGPNDGWARRVQVTLMTTDSLPNVRVYYQNAITSGGWSVVELEDKPDEVDWKLAKGASEAKVEIEAKAPGTVKIKVERKDR